MAQLDKLGLLATSLCALHCLIFPIILPALPFLGLASLSDHSNHELIDTVTISTSVGLGFLALVSGYRRYHRKLSPFAFLLVALAIYAQRHTYGEENEPYVIIVGSLVMLAAHFWNIRLSRESRNCGEESDQPKQTLKNA